jgi:hypothetical protein
VKPITRIRPAARSPAADVEQLPADRVAEYVGPAPAGKVEDPFAHRLGPRVYDRIGAELPDDGELGRRPSRSRSPLDLPLPYTVLLVRPAEGPLFYANPVDLASVPAIGSAVHATFARTRSGRVVARFVEDGGRE